jgi:hypothetical protein
MTSGSTPPPPSGRRRIRQEEPSRPPSLCLTSSILSWPMASCRCTLKMLSPLSKLSPPPTTSLAIPTPLLRRRTSLPPLTSSGSLLPPSLLLDPHLLQVLSAGQHCLHRLLWCSHVRGDPPLPGGVLHLGPVCEPRLHRAVGSLEQRGLRL